MIAASERPNPGETLLAKYVLRKLPKSYSLIIGDLHWLNVCDDYLVGEPHNASVLAAVKAAFAIYGNSKHSDPFELLIDAAICDTRRNLLE